jgi:hypothetical protein
MEAQMQPRGAQQVGVVEVLVQPMEGQRQTGAPPSLRAVRWEVVPAQEATLQEAPLVWAGLVQSGALILAALTPVPTRARVAPKPTHRKS